MSLKFSEDAEKEFNEILSRYPRKDAALLPALWLAQKEFGYLSTEAQSYIAQKLNLSLARVESVVSFYTLYKTKPGGKFDIQLCRNISCNLRGCEGLMAALESELGISPGETTPDGLFSYSHVECLAACAGAPAMQINGDYYESVTPESLKKLLVQLKDPSKSHG